MNCESTQQAMLDLGWATHHQQSLREVLGHLDQCETCRAAASGYERLRSVLEIPRYDRPRGGWEAFEQRLEQRVRASQRQSPAGGWWPFYGTGLGLAASFLLGMLSLELARRALYPDAAPSAPLASVDLPPALDTEHLLAQAQAFREIAELFEGQATWLLLADGQAEIGLSSQPIPAQPLLLLRLSMSCDAAVLSQADLAIVPGETAVVTVGPDRQRASSGRAVRYTIGTSRTDPTRLAIWADVLAAEDGPAVGSLATELRAKPDDQVLAGLMVTEAGSFELNVGLVAPAVSGRGMAGRDAGPTGAVRREW